MEMMNFYELLGVSYYATAEEIKDAYRKKVKEKHPDKAEGNVEQFNLILEAYEVLSNEEKRKRYDDFLFKTTKFNIQVAVPKEKNKVTQKNKNMKKKEEKLVKWKISSLLFLTTTLILSGILIYLLNEYQQAKSNNIILDNRLSSRFNEIQDLSNENDKLDSGLTAMIEENQDLVEKVKILKEENLQLNSNLLTLQSSLEQLNSEPGEEIGLSYVTLGSTEEEVLRILGTPKRIDFLTWSYGWNSWVSFDYFTKTVDGWNNDSGKLNIK